MVIAAGHVGSVVVGSVPRRAPSTYLEQVRLIAPPELYGRDAELRQLAAFCTEPDRGPYIWWQAPMWAGKSALMSTFVLHPPPGLRVVSFFVTGRLAGQDSRQAFREVMLAQLADLLGEALPQSLTPVTRDGDLVAMLMRAARHCADEKKRLVVVVDGLDEDGATATGSIASLLPATPLRGCASS